MKGISIIIPVYNTEKYVEKCIHSVLDEMKSVDQLILIDDGSTDLSATICEKYVSDRVLLISNDNHGVSFSRNVGIRLADKEYIMFVDSDDYLLPGWRTAINQGIKTEKDIVYFSESRIGITNTKDIIDNILCLPQRKVLKINASACWGKIFKLCFIKENNIWFDCELINGEDGFFCLQSAAKTDSYAILEEPDFYYYRTDNVTSATNTFNEKFISSNSRFIMRLKEALNGMDLFTDEEIQQRVEYVTLQSIYLVISKFSLIKEKENRRTYYSYLNIFDDFLISYNVNWKFGIVQNLIYILVKAKCYDISVCFLKLIRFIRNQIKGRLK